MIWPFHKRSRSLKPFVGKAIPDVPGLKPKPTQREVTEHWQRLAMEIGLMTGRIHKGNSFAFSMSLKRSSVTVPAATFDKFVQSGIIDAMGNIIE